MTDKNKDNASMELMHELMKQMHGSLARIEKDTGELKQGQIRIRDDLNTMRGDDLRLERMIAELDSRLERIEKRLDLVEA